MDSRVRPQVGFTLIELVVVIMILGILAAIGVPKFLNTSKQATDNGAKQSLGIIRDAIDTYVAQHGGLLPGADGQQTTLKSNLAPYLRGYTFPKCAVGEARNDQIRMTTGAAPIASSIGATAATHSWVYKYDLGEFYINSTASCSDGSLTYDQF